MLLTQQLIKEGIKVGLNFNWNLLQNCLLETPSPQLLIESPKIQKILFL